MISTPGGMATPNSRISVFLIDLSKPEEGDKLVNRRVILTGPQGRPFPIEFKVQFDSRVFIPERRYALSARIEMTGDKRLQYIGAYHHTLPMTGRTIYGVDLVVQTIC
ncbi:hypothetical protein BGX23_012117 [Mortierella sp. AD031]|nr:hypothetical protein BGX23_012117 [Mortierella sp. AD031]KAG0215620.1 hypothetical protein BGX33_001019 [Mortierella sp. NVP41]